MKNGSCQQLNRLSTNKIYNAIIAVESKVGLFRKVIWCSDLYRKSMECTNYPIHGKDHLWSSKTYTMDPTTLLIYERRRRHIPAWRRLSIRGTSHNSVHIILE